MEVQREELRTQAAATHLDTDGFSSGELEECSRRCSYPSLPRRECLQGEMWSESQHALKTERKSGSAERSFGTEPGQKPSVKISDNSFYPSPPYTSVKDYRTQQGEILISPLSRSPNYTPPPAYMSRASCSSGSRPHTERQHLSFLFSSRRAGTVTSPYPDRTEPQQECLPSSQEHVKNQQDIFTPQPSGCYEKYPTSHSDGRLPEPDRRRRKWGTIFCLVSHMGSSSSKNQPLKCHRIHRDKNVRFSNHVEELRRDREDLRKQSNEKRRFTEPNKKKLEDGNSNKNKNKIVPAVSTKSTSSVVPHYHITLNIPSWKEPKSHHCSHGIRKKSSKSNRHLNREDQHAQSELRNNILRDEKMGLMVIDATCVAIKVQFIASPEKEHVHYVSSCPNDSGQTDSSNQSSDSNCNLKSTEVGSSSPMLEVFNQTNHTSSEVQPRHKTLKERMERNLGNVLQDSFNGAHTLEETTPLEDSSICQIPDTLEGSVKVIECESIPIQKTSQPNEEATSSLMPEAEAMLDISEVTHRDAVSTCPGSEIMTNTKQEDELESLDRKFMLKGKNPTAVTDLKKNKEKSRCGATSEEFKQTLLRNTCELFSQRTEERDERRDLYQVLRNTSVENSCKPISPEDTATVENFSNVGEAETICDVLTEKNPWFLLYNSYKTSKVFDKEHIPREENSQETRGIFSLKGGHHQENLIKLQNLSPNLLSTSETQVSPPFLGYHVKNTDELFAYEGFSRRQHISNVWPNLINCISDTLIQKEIQREDRPSHAKQDAKDPYQTLCGNSMEKSSNACDHQDAVGKGNLFGEEIIYLSVKDIREPSDEENPLHKDGVEILGSVLHSEDVDQCETTDMKKNFSLNSFHNTEEPSLEPEHESSSGKLLHSGHLQNLCHILCGGSTENISELFEQKDHESKRSPSPDIHISKEFTPSLLSTEHFKISSYSPNTLLSNSLSSPVARSSHSKPSDSLSEVLSVHAQVCSLAPSTARDHVRAKHHPQSLWDAVSRIRKHTAPDSESEDEDSELWEAEEHIRDDEEPGMKEEESELGESPGFARNNGKEGTEEEERRLGKHDDDDGDDEDGDTVIGGEGERNEQESDLFKYI